jgi:hypothetical protein
MTDHSHGEGHEHSGHGDETSTETLLLENVFARHGSRILGLAMQVRSLVDRFQIEDWEALKGCKEHSDYVAVLGEEKLMEVAQAFAFGEMLIAQAHSTISSQFIQDVRQLKRDVAGIAEPTVPQQHPSIADIFGGGGFPPGLGGI